MQWFNSIKEINAAIDSEEQNLLSHFDTYGLLHSLIFTHFTVLILVINRTYKFINEGIMQGQGVVVAW